MLAFELYERVVTAAVSIRILPAYRRARLVNRAAPLVGIKEPTNRTVDIILLVTQDPFGLSFVHINACKAFLRLLDRQSKVSRKTREVATLDLDSRIAAAISGTL